MLFIARCMLAAAAASSMFVCANAAPGQPAATVEVDAREAPRGVQRVHLTLPVKPGKLTLLYPKWIVGEHMPSGPIGSLSALEFTANGQAIAWQRDAVDMFAFHLTIPRGIEALDVNFEVDAILNATDHNALRESTESLAIVAWNELVFYPAGTQSDDMQVAATLQVPAGWHIGTALPEERPTGNIARFAPVSLTTLIDSPVIAGRYFRTIELADNPAAYLDIAADSEAALDVSAETIRRYRQLVQQATLLFGATHYNNYHFLLTLSDYLGYVGLEHHQSCDVRAAERGLTDADMLHSGAMATLMSHEYVHSWNGKYRRPRGLATGNYDSPMRSELLWVYEGLTQYLGMVLSARSGLASPTDARDKWADVAAWLQTRHGRAWRPLVDTAIAAQIGYRQAPEWSARTSTVDFYDETAMLWLEADTLIRTKTRGAKSLDDFCRLFYGPPSTSPKVVPYDLDDVVNALNEILPYDWRGFWTERMTRVRTAAPLEGLAASGWHLTFATTPSEEQKGEAVIDKQTNIQYSLGFILKDDGAVITDVVGGSPADAAGIAPDVKLIAVNGRRYSKEVLDDAIKASGTEAGNQTLKLLVEKEDSFETADLHYAGGARYPRLEQDLSGTDYLTSILEAR